MSLVFAVWVQFNFRLVRFNVSACLTAYTRISGKQERCHNNKLMRSMHVHLIINPPNVQPTSLLRLHCYYLYTATPSQSLTLSTPPFISSCGPPSVLSMSALTRGTAVSSESWSKSLDHPFGHLLDCFWIASSVNSGPSWVAVLWTSSWKHICFFYINEAPRVSWRPALEIFFVVVWLLQINQANPLVSKYLMLFCLLGLENFLWLIVNSGHK